MKTTLNPNPTVLTVADKKAAVESLLAKDPHGLDPYLFADEGRSLYTVNARDLGDTSVLTDADWLKMRKHPAPIGSNETPAKYAVGGSMVAQILGLSPWQSPLDAFAYLTDEKMSWTGERNAYQKAMGHQLETMVLTKIVEAVEKEGYEVTLVQDKHMYQKNEIKLDADGIPVFDAEGNPELRYPFAIADIDGILILKDKKTGERKVVLAEAKTTQAHGFETIRHWKDGIVPEYYECQLRWYMSVLDIDEAWIGCMWGFSPADFAVIHVDRDMTIEKTLLDEVETFVENCDKGIKPDGTTANQLLVADYYTRLYGPSEKKETLDITAEAGAEEIFRELKRNEANREKLLASLDHCDKVQAGLLNQLMPLTKGYENVMFSNPKMRCYITSKDEMTRPSITEESVSLVDPALLPLGSSFSGTAFKNAIKEKVKELQKEAKSFHKKGDAASEQSCLDEAAALSEKLVKATIPAEWKGTTKRTVKFYDPNVKAV